MDTKWEPTESDKSSQPHPGGADEPLGQGDSPEYQMDTWQPLKIAGGILFIIWWLFLACMVVTSHKNGPVSYIASYGFLTVGLFAVIYVLAHFKCEKFLVSGKTITRYRAFAPPRTYQIREITRVVIHKGARGGTEFRVYMGKKKIFTLHDGMVNCHLFLTALEENQVQFRSSVF